MGDFVVYRTCYGGDKHPPFYIGSTSKKKIERGYLGSVSSRKWKSIVEKETKENKGLYSVEILSEFDTRQEALDSELAFHLKYSVVDNPLYYNESLACPNGFFGRDVSGENNPRFGVECPDSVKDATSRANKGRVVASSDGGETWVYISTEDFWSDRDKYTTPKGEFNHEVTEKTRKRVAEGTHHFCDPEVQKNIHEKRRAGDGYRISDSHKVCLSLATKARMSLWENKLFSERTTQVWLNAPILYGAYCINIEDAFTETGKLKRAVTTRMKEEFYKETGISIDASLLAKVVKKFKHGWIPLEDENYMRWVYESKKDNQ